jgi:hypothetical protein
MRRSRVFEPGCSVAPPLDVQVVVVVVVGAGARPAKRSDAAPSAHALRCTMKRQVKGAKWTHSQRRVESESDVRQ